MHLAAVRADGTEFPVDISLSPIPAAAGTQTIAVVRDRSQLRDLREASERLAREVRDAEAGMEQAAAIVESSAEAIGAVGLDHRVKLWNPAAERIWGYSEAEMIGQPITVVVPAELRADLDRFLDLAFAGESFGFVQERLRKDGTRFTASVRLGPVRDAEGRVTGACAFVRDVSAEIEAQKRLALAATLIASSQDGIGAVDPDRKIIIWNPALEEMLGIPAEQALGQDMSVVTSAEFLAEAARCGMPTAT